MKKLLLLMMSVFLTFTLSAQVTENFSDYTVGGKLAQQAQAMGRNYWTTWSNAPGGAEDGVIAEVSGNKAVNINTTHDQVLLFGGKTTGKWNFSMKMYIPTGACGYFNILANFNGASSTWSLQVYFGVEGQAPNNLTPGVGTVHAGGSNAAGFTFTHETWVDIKTTIDLDNDHAELFINNTSIYDWQYTLGTFGAGCPRVIDAMDIFPPVAASNFYIDDIVFEPASDVIYGTSFDDVPNNSYVAQSYPEWWTTWENNPGTAEDALITNEQASSTPQSAKCAWGTDLVFKAGNKTAGTYTIDFEMYIPNSGSGFFNLLHIFNGGSSEWAIGVYFNTNGTGGMPTGTMIQQNGVYTPFTFPYATWFPVHFDVDLDLDEAKISINNVQLLTWQFSTQESGGAGLRQLAAVDFYPPQAGSTFFIDNFVYAATGGATFPIINVTPTSINETFASGESTTVNKTITVTNTGTSMGDYFSWIELDIEPQTGTNNYTLTYSGEDVGGAVGYADACVVEVAAKYPLSFYCDKVGTYINKVAFYMYSLYAPSDNKLIARVYGGGNYTNPGDVLVEATLNGTVSGAWNEITLPTPVLLGGQDIWVAFEMQQPASSYLMTYAEYQQSGNIAYENTNWTRRNGGSWEQMLLVQGAPTGILMIKAFAQGEVLPGCYLSLTGDTYGDIAMGNTKTYTATIKTNGLADGIYKSTIFVSTSDENNPLFAIPCTLSIGDGFAYNVSFIVSDCETLDPISDATIIFNDEPITGYVVNNVAPGTYTYSISKNGYESKSGEIIVVDKDVIETVCLKGEEGINEFKLNCNIFPNPTSNNIFVERSSSELANIEIYNTMGMRIATYETSMSKFEIGVSNLSAGTYFIRVTEGKLSAIKSFVKH